MSIQILLADDHPVVLMGARAMLATTGIGEIAGEARSPDEVFAVLDIITCDVLVTDLSMPNGDLPDGTPYIQLLRQRHPLLPIVVMTMIGNVGMLDHLSKLGVLGLVEKGADLTTLPQAVMSAVARRAYISPTLKQQIDAHRQLTPRRNRQALSPRESEVIRLLTSGMNVSQIAEKLDRSLKTVSRQKMNAMLKLGVTNYSELHAYVREHELF